MISRYKYFSIRINTNTEIVFACVLIFNRSRIYRFIYYIRYIVSWNNDFSISNRKTRIIYNICAHIRRYIAIEFNLGYIYNISRKWRIVFGNFSFKTIIFVPLYRFGLFNRSSNSVILYL